MSTKILAAEEMAAVSQFLEFAAKSLQNDPQNPVLRAAEADVREVFCKILSSGEVSTELYDSLEADSLCVREEASLPASFCENLFSVLDQIDPDFGEVG